MLRNRPVSIVGGDFSLLSPRVPSPAFAAPSSAYYTCSRSLSPVESYVSTIMEVLGGASTVVGLANPIFQSAKVLRDRIKLVLYLPVCFMGLIHHWSWQVASEKAELLAVLSEYEKEITHLASLYNDHSALLEQHSLRTDLVEIAKYCVIPSSHTPGRSDDLQHPLQTQQQHIIRTSSL